MKNKKINIDFAKLGRGILNLLQSNAGTITGGLSMIALALLCKKLNIPYQVLTEPMTTDYSINATTPTGAAKMFLVPNNATEASMAAIYDGVSTKDWESSKEKAADQIYSILVSQKDGPTESTKTYAINLLRGIYEKSDWNSTKDHVNRLIAKIGKGEF